MEKSSARVLEPFFSGKRIIRFSSGGRSALFPEDVKQVLLQERIPPEAFFNQIGPAEGSVGTLVKVMETFEHICESALEKIKEDGLFEHVLPALDLSGYAKETASAHPILDEATQDKVSGIVIHALRECSKKQREQGKIAGIFQNKDGKENWDMHERISSCLVFCLYYVSVARRFGLRAETYRIPHHNIAGWAFGKKIHYVDPARGENSLPKAVIRVAPDCELDYRNPAAPGYFGLTMAWTNKSSALEKLATENRDPKIKCELLSKAHKAALEAVKLDPHDPNAWKKTGNIRYMRAGFEGNKPKKIKFLESALDAYCEALKIDNMDDGAGGKKGLVLVELGRTTEAEKAFDISLRINPQNAAALVGKGQLLLAKGEAKPALEMAETALKINLNASLAWRLKADACQKLGMEKEAEDARKKAEELRKMGC